MDDLIDVSFVLESLNQLLEQDADMLNTEVESNIRSLQSHLRQVLYFLKQKARTEDEDMRKNLNQLVRNLEVPVNTLAVDTASHRMMLCANNTTLQGVLKHIQDLSVDEGLFLAEDNENQEAKVVRSFHGDRLSYIEEEKEVLGFNNKVEQLVTQLTRGEQARLKVVSLVGRSGTGKTTLAKKVYNLDAVKHHFDFCAWVNVPWNCRPGELLQKILEHGRPITEEKLDNVKDEILTGEILKCFQGRKYLIVIDSLHEKDLWEKVKTAFPVDEGRGSRILLITQINEGLAGGNISLNDIGSLNRQECWELLSGRIPQDDKELMKLGTDIAERCKALPPSTILLLRGLLAREVTSKAWSKVYEILKEPLVDDGHESVDKKLFYQVYEKFPTRLSFCLIYFGMFPRGVEIPARQLIQQWMAEGFIHKSTTKKMEDLGEAYLQDLVGQSLVQVVARRTCGGVKVCKINDLFHKFCISGGSNIKFFQSDHCSSPECFQSTRRLRIHVQSAQEAAISQFTNYSDIRSFQFSIQEHDDRLLGQEWSLMRSGFKLLRVLNLGYILMHKIPNSIGELIHLRYLRINSPKSKHVPASICSLLNLQTLDLRESSVRSMPKGIWKMQQLRHIHFLSLHKLPEPQRAKNNALGSLQTLSSIRPTKVARNLMVKAKFPNLRRLKLFSQSKQETLEFLKSLDHLFHLESLKIEFATNVPYPQVAELPDPSAFPLTLTKITLSETRLRAECLVKIERLPNLQILKLLRNSVTGEIIEWNDSGFPQLQVLQMVELQTETVKVGGKAMRNLQSLCIKRCIKLTMIPPPTTWPRLQEVVFFWPSPNLRNTIREFRELNGCKVQVHPLCDLVDNQHEHV